MQASNANILVLHHPSAINADICDPQKPQKLSGSAPCAQKRKGAATLLPFSVYVYEGSYTMLRYVIRNAPFSTHRHAGRARHVLAMIGLAPVQVQPSSKAAPLPPAPVV
jgi:hypothetical protein